VWPAGFQVLDMTWSNWLIIHRRMSCATSNVLNLPDLCAKPWYLRPRRRRAAFSTLHFNTLPFSYSSMYSCKHPLPFMHPFCILEQASRTLFVMQPHCCFDASQLRHTCLLCCRPSL